MAIIVPNTNTFSLQDVWNAVKDHTSGTTGDLSDCFANAISNYFDPAYNNNSYAPANSMKRFRNYGPKGYPTTGVYTIPFPNYGVGIRVIGRLIYVSPDGDNLFIFVTAENQPPLETQPPINRLVRFTMQGFDLSTLAFHSDRVFMATPSPSFTERTIRFSDDGTRLMFLYDNHLPHTGNAIMYTFIMDNAWDIVSSFQDFVQTTLIKYSSGFSYADRMDFSEDGYSIVLLRRENTRQELEFYTLSHKQILPPFATINASSSIWYMDRGIANDIIGFNMFEDSFVPGISELAIINPSGQLSVGTVRVDSNPYVATYPYSEDYAPYAFGTDRYADVYTTANREYTYILERNFPSELNPLYPRVYLRVNN